MVLAGQPKAHIASVRHEFWYLLSLYELGTGVCIYVFRGRLISQKGIVVISYRVRESMTEINTLIATTAIKYPSRDSSRSYFVS